MKKNMHYRVLFFDTDKTKPLEVVVKSVTSSDLLGLVCLEGFVFNDKNKHVILPQEDEARKRFSKSERIHIPYHNLLMVEEFYEQEPAVKNLPFLKEIELDPHKNK